jgi:phosphatidylglycerophosphate synthase
MKRKFVVNLIFAVGINLLIKPFWVLGVERGVQNAIGASEYGFYFSLFSFSFLFNVILDFGINNYNNTFIAKYPHLLSKKFSQLVICIS